MIGILGGIPLAISLLVINVLQTLSAVVSLVSPRAFRIFNRQCAAFWWGACNLWMTHVLRTRVQIEGDSLPDDENAIVVVNHQCMSDIPALFPIGARHKRLGDMKWFVKDPLKYAPGIGWGLLFLDCIFLKRDWAKDQNRIEATFSRLKRHKSPFWLVSFSEGTRRTPKKLAASQEFARKTGVPVPLNVLIPRTKGFVATLRGLRESSQAVYDFSLYYPGGVPRLSQLILGRVKHIRLRVRRFSIDTLPQGDAELAQWLLERFREKDAWLSEQNSRT